MKNLRTSGSRTATPPQPSPTGVPAPPPPGKATPFRKPQPGQAQAPALAKVKRSGTQTITPDTRSIADRVQARGLVAGDDQEQRRASLAANFADPDYIPSLVARRKPDELAQVLAELQRVSADRNQLVRRLFQAIVDDKGLLAHIAATDPGIAVNYLVAADLAKFDLSGVLDELKASARSVVVKLLILHCQKKRDATPPSPSDAEPRAADSIGAALHDYMWQQGVLSIDEDWNNKTTGIAAQVYNSLWNARDYSRICELINMGVSTARAAILPKATGRGSKEGVWSGYVQPLDHLLSTYLKRVDDYDNGALGAHEKKEKVEGAKRVLAALSAQKPPGILTSYKEVMESELLKAFERLPGTFWGFEDVRLPYVEAARTKPGGMRPLRMMDLWAAVQDTIAPDNYRALLQDPAKTIAECVSNGIAKAEEAFNALAAGEPNPSTEVNYALMLHERQAYLDAFRTQATDFLDFLSKQGPEAKFLTAELTGKDAGKMMGALACKAGLWWARKKGEPIYYCLDGIDLDDVADYKTFKTKLINAGIEKRDEIAKAGGTVKEQHLFYEVITLAEMREILREENWPYLKGTVKFVKLGKILKGAELGEIDKVRQRMAESDAQAPLRKTPVRKAFDSYVTELGLEPDLVKDLDDVTLKRVVTKAKALSGLAAEAQHFLLFLEHLADCQVLYTSGVLPDIRMEFLDLAKERDPDARKVRAQEIATSLEIFPQMSQYLRDILTKTANRMAEANPIDINVLAEELYPPGR
ncbi:hypothetical protein [Nonomuraea sp. NPDC049400]|uniref:hypothetical protein n=1 Tax=Nonomuraea sp. NPDC049400 TaxID=3364352 RepID=UPI0037936E3B